MIPKVYCAFCRIQATRVFTTLDKSLWSVCDEHAEPFLKTAIELDPEKYDFDGYFEEFKD